MILILPSSKSIIHSQHWLHHLKYSISVTYTEVCVCTVSAVLLYSITVRSVGQWVNVLIMPLCVLPHPSPCNGCHVYIVLTAFFNHFGVIFTTLSTKLKTGHQKGSCFKTLRTFPIDNTHNHIVTEMFKSPLEIMKVIC